MKEFFISDRDDEELRLKNVREQIFDKFKICKSYSVVYDNFGATVSEYLNETNRIDHMYIRYKGNNFLRNRKIHIKNQPDFLVTFDYQNEGLDFYGRSMEPKLISRIKNTDKFELKHYTPIDVKYFMSNNSKMFEFYSEKMGIDTELYLPKDARVKFFKYDNFTAIIQDNKVIKTIEYDEYENVKVLYINQYDEKNILIVKNIDGVVVPIKDIDYKYDNKKFTNPLLDGKYAEYIDTIFHNGYIDKYGAPEHGYICEIPVLDSISGECRRIYLYEATFPFTKRDLVYNHHLYYLDIIYVNQDKKPSGSMERHIGYFEEDE